MTTWRITKKSDDNYHVDGVDGYTRIEEDVDGPKLMGMLTGKGLSVEQCEKLLSTLDTKAFGYETTIAFTPPRP